MLHKIGVAIAGAAPLAFYTTIDPATVTGDSSVGAIVGALAGGGFSLWYGWYVTTTTLPKIVAEFREEANADRTMFQTQIQAEREMFRAEITAYRADLRTLGEQIDKLTERK